MTTGGQDPFRNVAVFHSLSKRSNAAGLRSGFMAGDPRLVAMLLRWRTYGGPQIPFAVQKASAALWREETHPLETREWYRKNFRVAEQILHNRFGYFTPGGGFFLWLDVGDGEEATRRLWGEAHLKVLPGGYVCRETEGINTAERYIRVALVHDEKTTREAMTRLAVAVLVGSGRAAGSPWPSSGVTSLLPRKTTILPEGGRDFLHRRMMELVGVGVAAAGVALLLALFTYSPGDPSLNHATGSAPHNIVGLPGAYISDLLLQTFGLAIVLVPVALITWGVRMARTHHLGFFGLRLSLLLLALLMMSVACIGLGDVGGAATHAGPGGLVGLALVGRFREIVLTHSSGGSLALIEPVCAALAFIAMAPALGMNRTDLPLIFRILRAPFLWGGWLMRAGVGLWRGKPQSFDEESDLPAPAIGYAEIPGEIDASQYDPARFESRLEQIPEEGAPLPARDSLMVDAPYAPIERPADDIPEAPVPLQPHAPSMTAADSVRDRTLFDRLAGLRIEPILGRLRPAAPPPAEAQARAVRRPTAADPSP